MSYGEEDFSMGEVVGFSVRRGKAVYPEGVFLYEGELSFIFLLYSSKRALMSLTKL